MIYFSDTTFHDHVASQSIKKALFIVLSVGSEYFQSIRKGTFPLPMFRQRYRVRAALGIFLPSQVNQEVPPQNPASRRIFSPLTTSQRVPYHCTSVRGLCYTFSWARRSANVSFAIPVGRRAPPAICLGKNTSAHEPASIPSTSILQELANSEAQASLIDTPLLWAGGENKQSEEVSFFHANAITPGVPNATASSHPWTVLPILKLLQQVSLHAWTYHETISFWIGHELSWSLETCHCCSQQGETGLESHYFTFFWEAEPNLACFRLGNHDTGSKTAGLGLSLETDGVINSSSLRSSRSVLLCKYNFLCLPRSAKPGIWFKKRRQTRSSNSTITKSCVPWREKKFIPYMTTFTWRCLELLTHREGLISWTL